MENSSCVIIPSPIGELLLVAEHEKIIGLYTHKNHADILEKNNFRKESSPILDDATTQLNEYFSGTRQKFTLPLAPKGTDFQKNVWQALDTINYGKTASYGAIAQAITRAKASRAIGMANSKNPIAIIIPCHRIIGANGKLTGYNGGIEIKEFLLEHERKFV